MSSFMRAGRGWPARAVALVGCALVIAGTCLPWMTLFAGLKKMNGFSGLNGWLIAGAAVVTAFAVVIETRSSRPAKAIAITLASSTLVFSLWLLRGLATIVGDGRANPMMLTRAGPGLYVITMGALMTLAASLPRAMGKRKTAG
ncbi:MAG TPA: hypothetical protein VD758_10520 [Gemmatimonadaceae bacterium]|nr:hypothetical protein [Gemmatimonadaceae bacterium]